MRENSKNTRGSGNESQSRLRIIWIIPEGSRSTLQGRKVVSICQKQRTFVYFLTETKRSSNTSGFCFVNVPTHTHTTHAHPDVSRTKCKLKVAATCRCCWADCSHGERYSLVVRAAHISHLFPLHIGFCQAKLKHSTKSRPSDPLKCF